MRGFARAAGRRLACFVRQIHMPRYSKSAHGRRYVVHTSLALGAWALLAVVVTLRVLSADQLGTLTKVLICLFLWGVLVWWSI